VVAFLYQNGNAGDEIVQLFALSSVSSPKQKRRERNVSSHRRMKKKKNSVSTEDTAL